MLDITSSGWRIGQFHGEPRYTVRRLSAGRWRPAWRVVAVNLSASLGALYEAVALGLYDRARQIQLAIGGKGAMRPPLRDDQRTVLQMANSRRQRRRLRKRLR